MQLKTSLAWTHAGLFGLSLFVSASQSSAQSQVMLNQIRGHYVAAVAMAHFFRVSECGKQLLSFSIESLPAAKQKVRPFLRLDEQRLLDAGEVEKMAARTFKEVEQKFAKMPSESLRCSIMSGYIYGSFYTAKAILEDLEQSR